MNLSELQGRLNQVQNQLITLKEMRNHQEAPFVAAMLPLMEKRVAEDFDQLCEEWTKSRSDTSTPVLT